eukprot:835467-Rhodomonas_salina.4
MCIRDSYPSRLPPSPSLSFSSRAAPPSLLSDSLLLFRACPLRPLPLLRPYNVVSDSETPTGRSPAFPKSRGFSIERVNI